MSDTDLCARCGGDCGTSSCPECGGCENTGTQPCPGCQPQASDREMPECEICAYPEPCDCDDPDYCSRCYSSGVYVPHHCCDCGGSPYCDCCPNCGRCVADCGCPVEVQMSDGSTRTL